MCFATSSLVIRFFRKPLLSFPATLPPSALCPDPDMEVSGEDEAVLFCNDGLEFDRCKSGDDSDDVDGGGDTGGLELVFAFAPILVAFTLPLAWDTGLMLEGGSAVSINEVPNSMGPPLFCPLPFPGGSPFANTPPEKSSSSPWLDGTNCWLKLVWAGV